jgi:phosphopantetheinyl transferase (holo-ACP synthase)
MGGYGPRAPTPGAGASRRHTHFAARWAKKHATCNCNGVAIDRKRYEMTKKSIEVVEKPASGQPESLLPGALKALKTALDALHACIARVAKVTTDEDAEYDKDMASHLSWMTKNAAQIMGEVRKAEVFETKRTEGYTPTLVLAYLRDCDPADRRKVMSELEVMATGGSVLG